MAITSNNKTDLILLLTPNHPLPPKALRSRSSAHSLPVSGRLRGHYNRINKSIWKVLVSEWVATSKLWKVSPCSGHDVGYVTLSCVEVMLLLRCRSVAGVMSWFLVVVRDLQLILFSMGFSSREISSHWTFYFSLSLCMHRCTIRWGGGWWWRSTTAVDREWI